MFIQITISQKAAVPSALDTEKERREKKGSFRFVKVTFACSVLPGGSRNHRESELLHLADPSMGDAPGNIPVSLPGFLSQHTGSSSGVLCGEASPFGVSDLRAPFTS